MNDHLKDKLTPFIKGLTRDTFTNSQDLLRVAKTLKDAEQPIVRRSYSVNPDQLPEKKK